MILKRYGARVASVDPHFDPRAITEVAFRRNGRLSMAGEEFEEAYERVAERELTARHEGEVQIEVETDVLRSLEEGLRRVEEEAGEEGVVVVESREGEDYPKTREKKVSIVVEGENRFRFHRWVEPPLRVGIYRRKPGPARD